MSQTQSQTPLGGFEIADDKPQPPILEPAPDIADELTKILKSLAEAAHADGWGGINSYSLDMVAEARAAIEALYAARFERALEGKEKYDGVEPTYDRMIGARNRLRAEARTRWYTPESKGEPPE